MKILLVQTGFLGDVILSTPVIERILALYPNAKLSLLTTPGASGLFRDDHRLEEVIVYDKRKLDSGILGLFRKAKELRARKFDIVFSLHKSYRTALLLWLAKIPVRYGFKEAAFSRLYTRTAPRNDLSHEVLRNLAILRCVGEYSDDENLEMLLVLKREKEVEEIFSGVVGNRYIGIAPGSVWATKRWTVDGFSTVAAEFSKRGDVIVLLGGADDVSVSEKIAASCMSNVINLVGQIDLNLSAAIISKLDLLITNDSAPLHVASAVKTPVVALFCATVQEFGFGPWKNLHEIVEVQGLQCRPCGRHGGNNCPTGTNACQIGITATNVISACERVLEKSHVAEGKGRRWARS